MRYQLNDAVVTTVKLERYVMKCARSLDINVSQAAREGVERAVCQKIGLSETIDRDTVRAVDAIEAACNGVAGRSSVPGDTDATGGSALTLRDRTMPQNATANKNSACQSDTPVRSDIPANTPTTTPSAPFSCETESLPPGIRQEFLAFMALRSQQGKEEHEERIGLMKELRRTAEDKHLLLQKQEKETRQKNEEIRAGEQKTRQEKEAEERRKSARSDQITREAQDHENQNQTLLRQFTEYADQSLSNDEVIRYRNRMLDHRHQMMNLPSAHSDPEKSTTRETKQIIEDQYHTFLISVCTQAGFVPGTRTFSHHQTPDPTEERLRNVIEEYIVERAFRAESPEPDEEEEDEPERSGPFCRDTPATGSEKNSTTDREENRKLLPQNRYPAITSPDNTGRNLYSQERA